MSAGLTQFDQIWCRNKKKTNKHWYLWKCMSVPYFLLREECHKVYLCSHLPHSVL